MSKPSPVPAMPPYVVDIHAQPDALAAVLDAGLDPAVAALMGRVRGFDRVVLTGMGASLFAHHPTFLALAAAGVPVWNLDTSELLGPAGGIITSRTLLWITSQSGGSGEVTALLESLPRPRPVVLGSTNDLGSPLARAADVVLELRSGEERTVSTRSYVNSLATHALAVAAALGTPPAGLAEAPTALGAYLADWDAHVAALEATVTEPTVFVIARGASLASAMTGALIIKEAAKAPVEAMSAPQFRHGPLELADHNVAVIVLAGAGEDVALNRQIAADLRRVGANAVWLESSEPGRGTPAMPAVAGPAGLPIAEILPLQALSVALARRRALEPGAFRQIEKVTTTL